MELKLKQKIPNQCSKNNEEKDTNESSLGEASVVVKTELGVVKNEGKE